MPGAASRLSLRRLFALGAVALGTALGICGFRVCAVEAQEKAKHDPRFRLESSFSALS
jgi:hypothetical protein